MDFERFNVTGDELNRRLDRVSKRILEARGVRGNVFVLLRKGLIRVNDQRSQPSYLIKAGDVICVAKFLLEDGICQHQGSTPATTPAAVDAMATTLFRNEHLWVLNKKPGVCVQPGGSAPSLFDAVKSCSAQRSLSFKPGCLHRIDSGTSGIVVFSQSTRGARWFSAQLREGAIKRSYLAVAQGTLPQGEVVLDQPIAGKRAVTRAHLLDTGTLLGQPVSLVLAELQTGRKHQIRIHLAQHGNPLLGDTRYGGIPLPGGTASEARYFLHAAYMKLGDNPLGAPAEIRAPLHEDLLSFVRKTFADSTAIVEKFKM